MTEDLKEFLKDHIHLVKSENTTELLLQCPCNLLHRLCRFLVLCGVDPEDLKPYYTYTPLPESFEKYVEYVLKKLKDYLSWNFDVELTIGKKGIRRLTGNTIVQYWSLEKVKTKLQDAYENNELPTDDSSTEYFVDLLDSVESEEYVCTSTFGSGRLKIRDFMQEMDSKYEIR